MINFNTENLILVCYPNGAGGKFLINCLGLSNNAVFQDAELANKQLLGEFDVNDKFLYLKNKIQNTKTSWNDLGLGCRQFFGIGDENYNCHSPDVIKNLDFHSVINKLSNDDKKFFLVGHHPSSVERYRRVWQNAKIIYFKNCDNFILKFRKLYHHNDEDSWRTLRGIDWPPLPPRNIEEYIK